MWFLKKYQLQCLIIGADNAGKTTLLEQLKGMFSKQKGIPPDKIPPTVGLNGIYTSVIDYLVATLTVLDNQVAFWDVGGNSRMRSIWTKYYSETHGLIFILDSADKERFAEVKQLITDFIHHPDLEGIPVLICCNKQDRSDAEPISNITQELGLNEILLYQSTPYRICPTSCLTGSGLRESINWIIEQASHTKRAINFNS